MKKLFFTAIILVAFSSVSMANTIFLNEPSHIENKTNVKDKPTMEFLPYCTIVFLQTYLGVDQQAFYRTTHG